jgi:hypothetical protein
MNRTMLKGYARPHESVQHLVKYFTGLLPMLVTPPLKSTELL